MVTPAAGGGRMRVSHAGRERVVDALKAAFVQGRLTLTLKVESCHRNRSRRQLPPGPA